MRIRELYRGIVQNMAVRREIAINDAVARAREFKPDGSEKSAAEIAKEDKEFVERMRASSKTD